MVSSKLWILFIAFFALLISSCSNDKTSIYFTYSPSSPIITKMKEVSVVLDNPRRVSNSSAQSINFGIVQSGQIISKKIYLDNKTSDDVNINLSDLVSKISNTNRYLFSNNTCQAILKSTKSCSFDISLSYVSSAEDYVSIESNVIDYSSNKEFGKLIISGEKAGDSSVESVLSGTIKLDKLSDSFIVDGSQSVIKKFYMSNISDGNIMPPIVIAPENGVIQNNICAALDQIKPNGTCYFEVKYEYDQSKPNYNTQIKFSMTNPLLNTTNFYISLVIVNVQVGSPAVSAAFSQWGTINVLTEDKTIRLYITNTGSVTIDASTSIIQIPSPFILVATNCDDSLNVGLNCFYDVKIDPALAPHMTSAVSTGLIGTIPFTLVAGPGQFSACEQGYDLLNGICILHVVLPSIDPVLGLEDLPFINSATSTHSFGLIDLSLYDSNNMVSNGVLQLLDNNDSQDYVKIAYPDFVDYTIDPIRYSYLGYTSEFSTNLHNFLSKLTEIRLAPRHYNYDYYVQTAYSQNSYDVQTVYASDMTQTLNPNEAIKIIGTSFTEKLVLDSFSPNSKFYFDGNGSSYQMLGLSQNARALDSSQNDIVEFRSPLVSNEVINISNQGNSILMKNSTHQLQGTFVNIDALNLGRAHNFFMAGQDPDSSLFDRSKRFNIYLNNYRTKDIPLGIHIYQNSQVNLAVDSSDYANYLLNPGWIPYPTIFNTPQVQYMFSSLLKEGYPTAANGGVGNGTLSENIRWNNYANNPNVEVELKEAKTLCGSVNQDGSNSEISVKRGYSNRPSNPQITDNFCGVRKYEVITGKNQTLNISFTSTAVNPFKHFQFGFSRDYSDMTSNGNVNIYVPSESNAVYDNSSYVNIDGYNNNMACGNKIINHKFGTWFHAPNNGFGGQACINELSNTVALDANPNDIERRVYDGYQKVRIYDSAANKSNWSFTCEMDGAYHVLVNLYNSSTNKHISFFEFARNKVGDNHNLGFCGNKLEQEKPNYWMDNTVQVIGTSCSLDEVLNGTNDCISDNDGLGTFRVEFVDTSSSSETLNSFIGR